jgi:histidyl-tRNA synthetase
MSTFRAPKGTFDLIPPTSAAYQRVRAVMAETVQLAGYQYIETPAFEDTALFKRGVGESTDIVNKEMYTFTTRGGDSLTLKPEGTASVLRAVLQANLQSAGQLPVKLYYASPFFRYERPQKGRYRQFSQFGAEALGAVDPQLDTELILLAADSYRRLGLKDVRLLLNTLGDATCRPVYRAALQDFLRGLDLDEATRERIEINPLRVLDDKRPDVQAQLVGAPLIGDYLCEDCKAFHSEVRELLTAQGQDFEDDPKLVRGLDYYTRTTFEFVHDGLGAQSAIGGGGRYDGLSETLGGPSLPSVGWGLGVDRTVLAMEAEGLLATEEPRVQVFAVPLNDEARRLFFGVLTELRRQGVSADTVFGARGLKGAMKAADRSGARYALVAGERDLAEGVVQVKDLVSGEQSPVAVDQIIPTIKEKLS